MNPARFSASEACVRCGRGEPVRDAIVAGTYFELLCASRGTQRSVVPERVHRPPFKE